MLGVLAIYTGSTCVAAGTLYECGRTLLQDGASSVSAFCTHGVFPNDSWKRFSKIEGGDRAIFDTIWITNSNPTVTAKLPTDDCFEVLDLTSLVLKDL